MRNKKQCTPCDAEKGRRKASTACGMGFWASVAFGQREEERGKEPDRSYLDECDTVTVTPCLVIGKHSELAYFRGSKLAGRWSSYLQNFAQLIAEGVKV
ncbi:hypothetical protein Hypma_002889 [Hypsizygus marmoreus]|uniref:Uncharacterized protein n=1 Tax=Hypsizygus marmoreus TaxID=39966 RepID=A0A369J6Z8_HYPMA|nr:hypothetical protein Hypma_002889 [Hypsizygus marmoreus]